MLLAGKALTGGDGWLSNQSAEQTFVSFFDRFEFRTAATAL